MLLADIVVLTLGAALGLALGYALLRRGAAAGVLGAYPGVVPTAAVAACAAMVGLMGLRSLSFGVDTVAYADLFTYYCNGGPLSDVEGSFRIATWLLNGLMFGACSTPWLPAAWIVGVVVPILLIEAPARLKIFYLCAFLFSIVGIELSTNALRQGLSVGMMLWGVSLLNRMSITRVALAMLLGLFAVAFHASAALFIGAYLLARLRWSLFLSTVGLLIWLTLRYMDAELALPFAGDFLYEIQKYAEHEGDEIWIRVLAFACVLAALAAPVLAGGGVEVRRALSTGPYAIALRLGVLCLPFLALPYFGYRFVYGVYPVILFLTLAASMLPAPRRPLAPERPLFLWIAGLNVLVLLAWSAGSSYMREVPFL